MADLPSIEDLLKKGAEKKAAAQKPAPKSAKAGLTQPTATKGEQLTEKMGAIELQGKEAEAQAQAQALKLNYVDLKGFPISPDALTQVPEETAKKLKAVCFLFSGSEIRVGAVNPQDPEVENLLKAILERNKATGEVYKISEQSLQEAIKLYATLPKIKQVVKGVQITQDELEKYQSQMNNFADIAGIVDGANVTDLLAILIAAALKLKTSDIHIEAEEKGIAVRFRVDGILQEITVIPKEQWKKIINRIKLIAGLKLNIADRPQDGRFTIFQKGKKIDVRTSTMPTAFGESVVMRILNPDSVQLGFEKLGFRKAALERLLPQVEKPHGMVITTGPTGSGKTTTLYAILNKLNTADVKIITLEDPVEYKLKGINQSQIDHSKEYTFAKGLRSILRQDPDIVMVGEIRDLETADTAIQAALTGHMLISTLHTNDAAGAIPRFTAMGVKPFLLAPALNAIMGQRLARRLCGECKNPATLDDATKKRVEELIASIPENSGETKPTTLEFFSGEGCDKCNGTGYKGRVGLYEILTKNAEIEQFILSGEISEYKTREVASAQGMVTMAQDGILKALDGETSIEEIKRTTGL